MVGSVSEKNMKGCASFVRFLVFCFNCFLAHFSKLPYFRTVLGLQNDCEVSTERVHVRPTQLSLLQHLERACRRGGSDVVASLLAKGRS